MKHDKPFLIDADGQEFENHISEKESENDYPFEFSRSNVWDQNFFAPENSNISFDTVYSQLNEIKLLLKDIKAVLSDIFEIKTAADDE